MLSISGESAEYWGLVRHRDYWVPDGETTQPALGEAEETRKYSVLSDQNYLFCNDPLHLMEAWAALCLTEADVDAASIPQIVLTGT